MSQQPQYFTTITIESGSTRWSSNRIYDIGSNATMHDLYIDLLAWACKEAGVRPTSTSVLHWAAVPNKIS